MGNNQAERIRASKTEDVTQWIQTTAENIRVEARQQLLEYSTTHHMKASQELAANASNRIDIKAAQVKTN